MRKYKQKNPFTEKASKLFENRITDLYDLYITHKTQLSCLTVDFTPEKIHRGEYQSQKLILGQCWNSSSPKIRPSLLVIDLNLSYPQNDKIINDWSENSQSSLINTDIHGWIETIVKIPHEGDVNIARCCPQKSQIIATKTSGGYVNLYDYRFFPSTPEVNSCCKPQMRLEGHGKTDGYALSWNSKNEGIIVSGSYDGLVCVWDISSGGGAKKYSAVAFKLPVSFGLC
jgi:WD40 repeat protein